MAEELVNVEAEYINSLSELLDMKRSVERLHVCTSDDVAIMFPNFDELHRLHTDFHRQIEQEVKKLKIDENHLIGDVISRMFFRPELAQAYMDFGMNSISMKQTYDRYMDDSDKFEQLDEKYGSKNFKFYCLTPIQRLPRYQLLIKGLIKETHPSHDDHEYLLKSERQVAVIAEKLDRIVADAKYDELKHRVTDVVMNIFEDFEEILVNDEERASIQYIRQESIHYHDAAKREPVERTLWLLNNIIVISHKKDKPYKLASSIDMNEARQHFPTIDLGNKHKVVTSFLTQGL